MPRTSRIKHLTDEEKKIRRREQKKLSMRRARAKLTETAVEEIRKKDRERYYKKRDRGEIKTIDDYTPRQQRQIRKMWREKSKKRRQLLKMRKATSTFIQENTPPSSPFSSFSRIEVGRAVAARNKREKKAENETLKKKVLHMAKQIKKYRMRIRRLEERKQKASNVASSKKKVLRTDVRKAVHDFLIQDEYSRLTSGKNDTITRKKSKRQIRLLNDTLLNLHVIFKSKTGIKISYQTFRRYRPFWVLFPKTSARNTCLCTLHENNDQIIRSLQKAKVVSYRSASDAVKVLCCNNTLNPKCLERECQSCLNKKLVINNYNENDYITYDRWVTKNVDVIIKGEHKKYKKCLKETVKTTKGSLVKLLNSNLPLFMQHVANMIHQIRSIQTVKQKLTSAEGLLHIDFSENYQCKYSAEVQSAHFGGSKPQLSLHTCVYYSNAESPNNGFQTTSMCSISENLRHDPVMICAHLKPILQRIKEISPNLTELHILSDGPTTQYRNKSMFFLIVNFISQELNDVNNIIWHYSEKGHGKGAPDGVGGCIKRICDNSVAMGKDVPDYDSLMLCLKENCKAVEIYGIGDPNVQDIQEMVAKNKMNAYKGTFKIHQLSWNRSEPNILHVRRLSCLSCATNAVCPHFEIGQIKVPFDDTPSHSPVSLADAINISPRSVDTANASTITYRSNMVTPEEETVSQDPPSRPYKRSTFLSDSDDSDEIFPPQRLQPLRTDGSDEDDLIIQRQQAKKPFFNPFSDSEDDEPIF